MKHVLLAALVTLIAASASAQTRIVLTNKDLGKPVAQKITLTPEQWRAFVARQFVAPPTPSREQRYADLFGPRVTIIPDTTPQPYIPPSYPLQAPFYMSTYVGPTVGGYPLGTFVTGGRRHHRR